jgi:MFS family permease
MQEQSRKYLIYLVILMGSVALLDWYLSTAIAVALPHLLEEYSIKDFEFSMWEALYLIPTLFIFLLNGLNDIIGRKLSILLLLLLMGLPSIAIFYFANNFHLFMIFYAIINFALVSNMWTIPMEEEAPASSRGKLMGIVYSISLIPLAPIASFIIIPRFGWKGIYAFGFVFMLLIIFGWLFMRETKRYEKIKEERKKGIRKKHFFGIGVIKKKDFRYIAIGTAIWFCWLAISFHLKYVGRMDDG